MLSLSASVLAIFCYSRKIKFTDFIVNKYSLTEKFSEGCQSNFWPTNRLKLGFSCANLQNFRGVNWHPRHPSNGASECYMNLLNLTYFTYNVELGGVSLLRTTWNYKNYSVARNSPPKSASLKKLLKSYKNHHIFLAFNLLQKVNVSIDSMRKWHSTSE